MSYVCAQGPACIASVRISRALRFHFVPNGTGPVCGSAKVRVFRRSPLALCDGHPQVHVADVVLRSLSHTLAARAHFMCVQHVPPLRSAQLDIMWQELMEGLEECMDVNGARQLHMDKINAMLTCCILSKQVSLVQPLLCRRMSRGVSIEGGLFFSTKSIASDLFLNPLDALIPKIPFSFFA